MSIPKYMQMKQSLLYEIKNGKFKPGEKFYSEAELKEKFNVSSITAIKALQCLVNDGYLVRYQGKGTYISKAKKGKIVKFSDIEKYHDAEETTEVLDIQKMTDARIAKQLGIPAKESFYRIKRLRRVDGKPVMVQNSYIIHEFIRDNEAQEKELFQSIYTKINRDYGIDLYQADSREIMEICFPAPDDARELLGLDAYEPCAMMKRYTYLFDGRPIEYIESYKRWDYFSIEIVSV